MLHHEITSFGKDGKATKIRFDGVEPMVTGNLNHATNMTFPSTGSMAMDYWGDAFALSGTTMVGVNMADGNFMNSVDTGDVMYLAMDDISYDQLYGMTGLVDEKGATDQVKLYKLDAALSLTALTYSGKVEFLSVQMQGYRPGGMAVSNGQLFIMAVGKSPDHLKVVDIAGKNVVRDVAITFPQSPDEGSDCKALLYNEFGSYFLMLDSLHILWKLEYNSDKTILGATKVGSTEKDLVTLAWSPQQM